MADDPITGGQKPTGQRQRGPRLLPYVVGALVASSLFAYYLIDYVPSRTTYFLALRFRTLALLSGQVKAKAENLNSGIREARSQARMAHPDKCPTHDGDQDPDLPIAPAAECYIELLLPEARLVTPSSPASGVNLSNSWLVGWRDLLPDRAHLNSSETGFDDILVADSLGAVVFQDHANSPRLDSLRGIKFQLSPEPPEKESKTPPSVATLPNGSTFTTIELGGTESYLLVQPFAIELGDNKPTYYMLGLTPVKTVRSQAMHVPREYLLLAFWLLVLVFLTLPFIKITTLSETERVGLKDVVALTLCSCLLFASSALLFLVPSVHFEAQDLDLKALADDIDKNMASEFLIWQQFLNRVGETRDGLGKSATDCPVELRKLQDRACLAMPKIEQYPGITEARERGGFDPDVFFWINGYGEQIDKFTTKKQVTVKFPVANYGYFHKVLLHDYWGSGGAHFIVEPMRSPTTGLMAFVFTVPATDKRDGALALAMNAVPVSLVDTVVPPEYEFAVIDATGTVQFHKHEERSLQENFFNETDDSDELTALVEHRQSGAWEASYRGSPYLGFVKPVEQIPDCPWSIITFRAKEPSLDFQARQQGGAIILVLLGSALPILICSALLVIHRIRTGAVHPMILAALWPNPRLGEVYRISRNVLILLAGATLAIVLLTSEINHDCFNAALIYFLITPTLACAIPVIIYGLKAPHRAAIARRAPSDRDCSLWLQQMIWVLVCASFLPACGDALLAFRVEDANRLQDWLFHTVLDHKQRLSAPGADTNSSSALEPEKDSGESTRRTDGSQPKCSITAEQLKKTENSASVPLFSYTSDRKISACVSPPTAQSASISLSESLITGFNGLLNPRHPSTLQSSDSPNTGEKAAQTVKKIELQSPHWRVSNTDRTVYCETALGSRTACASGEARLSPNITWPNWAILLAVLVGVPVALWNVLGMMFLRKWQSSTGKPKRSLINLESLPQPIPNRLLYLSVPGEDITVSLAQYLEKTKGRSYVIKPDVFRGDETEPANGGATNKDWAEAQLNEILYRIRESGIVCFVVQGFDHFLASRDHRAGITRLLEDLAQQASGKLFIVLESCVDPLSMIDRYKESGLDELALNGRLRRLLIQFTLAGSEAAPTSNSYRTDLRRSYDPRRWREYLRSETAALAPLQSIRLELENLWSNEEEVDSETLIGSIQRRGRAFFETIWHELSKAEKIALVQIAEGCLPNPKTIDTISELARKRLLIFCPEPRIFSESFRGLLCERDRVAAVHRWELDSKRGPWRSVRVVLGLTVFGGILFFAFTQGMPVGSLLTLVTSTGALFFPRLRQMASQVHVSGDATGVKVA